MLQVRKYKSGKYYSPRHRSYINLEDLKNYVCSGGVVQVTRVAPSNTDITKETLLTMLEPEYRKKSLSQLKELIIKLN